MRRSERLWLAAGVALAATFAAIAMLWARQAPEASMPAAMPAAAASPPAQRGAGAAQATLERQERLARYRAWQALSEPERLRLQQARTEFAALPPERQQALRAQFDGLDRLYRDGWRLGPALGADYVALQPLLGYVPEAQRERLLAVLHSLSDEQRARLALLSQRTPPQDRDVLRRSLLATPPERREDWLARNLAR